MKRSLPPFDPKKNINYAPHVVILGAGASKACLPDGDENGLQLPLMNDLIETLGLGQLLSGASILWEGRNFEDIYVELFQSGQHNELLTILDEEVHSYFSKIKLPPYLTIYDKLLYSLRKKDLIATFNWDPLLFQASKRFPFRQHAPKIVFLHGNVAMGACLACRVAGEVGFSCNDCGKVFEPVPLLYPITEKNYDDNEYIKSAWDGVGEYIQKAYILTIFGYSAPRTDVAARDIFLESWNENPYKELAQIEIIDTKDERTLRRSWELFDTGDHCGIFNKFDYIWMSRYARRSCETFFTMNLRMRPVKRNALPKTKSLKEIKKWVEPLIEEEDRNEKFGDAFSLLPTEEIDSGEK